MGKFVPNAKSTSHPCGHRPHTSLYLTLQVWGKAFALDSLEYMFQKRSSNISSYSEEHVRSQLAK